MSRKDMKGTTREWDEYTTAFITSPLYVEGVSRAVKSARLTFQVSIWLNVALFVIGLALLVVGAVVALSRGQSLEGLGFAGVGTAELAILFWSKPLDRIQSAMTSLTQAQVAWFGYMAQYDSLSKALIAVGKKGPNATDEIIKLVDKMREATEQILAGLQK